MLDAIVAQLERALPAMTVASRDLTAKTYESAPPHKALVLRPVAAPIALSAGRRRKGRSKPRWRVSRSITVHPCALLAVDNVYRADPGGNLVMRDMPLVH